MSGERGVRHLRRAPVAVLVGDGLDAAAPRHRDVAVEETQVNAHHRHPAYRSGSVDRVPLRAATAGTATPARSKGEDPLSVRKKSRAGRRNCGGGAASPRRAAPPPPCRPPSLHCGSPPPTGSYCGLRLRARPREARVTGRLRLGGLALGRSRQRSATARCCGVAGSREGWKGGEAPQPRGRAGRRSRDLRRQGKRVSGQPWGQSSPPPLAWAARPHRPSHGPENRGPGCSPPASPPRGAVHVRLALRRLAKPLCEVAPIVRCQGRARAPEPPEPPRCAKS